MRKQRGPARLVFLPGCCAIAFNPVALASEGSYDRIWSSADLYRSDDSSLRQVSLSGRLQGDAYHFEQDDDDADDLLWRRFRFGFKSRFAGDWLAQLEADFDLNESSGDWYSRLTDAYIGWQPDRARDLRILKHSAGFTLDGATSSKKLLTLQRNNLTNNLWFTAEYFTGISMSGAMENRWNYRVGFFSSDGNEELSKFDAAWFSLTSVGYDWGERLGVETASLRLDYVYNRRDENANTRDLSNVVTLTGKWEQGNWGLWADLGGGRGYYGQGDLRGLVLMPFYKASNLVQWVGRYTRVESDERNGVRLGRYENALVEGRGDDYEEFYLGLNLFFYDHKFKWQTGLQFAKLRDEADDGGEFDGWGLTTGLRFSW